MCVRVYVLHICRDSSLKKWDMDWTAEVLYPAGIFLLSATAWSVLEHIQTLIQSMLGFFSRQ
jgi:hypothetical protein